MQSTSGLIESIGYVAGMLTTLAFVPQLVKTWRSRSARDLSLTMLVAFTIGVVLWLVYGATLASWPLVTSNAVTLGLTTPLLVLKLREVGARVKTDSQSLELFARNPRAQSTACQPHSDRRDALQSHSDP